MTSPSVQFPTKLSVLAPVALAVFLFPVSSCTSTQANPAAPPPPAVEVAEVVQKDVPIYSEWVAILDGYVNAQIQPRVSGYVIKQNYKEGSVVKKGQILFEIDPRPFKAALDQAKAQLAQADAQLGKATQDVERDKPLAREKAIAQSQLDTEIQAKLGAHAQVQAAQANVEQAELNMEFTKVTSLVSGIAGSAQVQIGNLVGPSSVLTSVSQVDPIKAYFTVSEQEFTDFHRRFPTQASVEEQRKRIPLELMLADGKVYEQRGTIYFADREVNPATGAIRIAGVFPNPNNLLRPGGYGRVRASVNTRNGALLVPQRAVIELQGSQQVAVVGSDNKVNIRPVTAGERISDQWIVSGNLKPGERVIVEGLQKVKEGGLVNPKPASATNGGRIAMSKFFINRPIVAIVISILTVIVGAITIVSLPVSQFPAIAPPEVQVQTTYVGADAQTVEQSVATPIEQQMSGVDNMNYMYSVNSSTGETRLIVDFDVKTDPNTDLILTQIRETQAASQLPVEVTNFGVTVQKTLTAPLMLISLYSPSGVYDSKFLANYAYINLYDPLSRVPGIGSVQVFGAGKYAMRLWVKPDQLAKLGITVPDIVSAIQSQNTVNPAGQIGGEPVPKGQEYTYSVRAQGRLTTPEEFEHIVVRATPDGGIVRIKDVARVELGAQDYTITSSS